MQQTRFPSAGPPTSLLLTGFLASLLAGSATGLGALPLLGARKPDEALQQLFIGFAAGVMLAASFFSLIIPGMEHAQTTGSSVLSSSVIVIGSMLLGAAFVGQIKRLLPPLQNFGLSALPGVTDALHRRIWLFVGVVTLHNLPEGLAVGVSFGTGDEKAGWATALGIGLQNIPEGLAVGVALMSIGYSRSTSAFGAFLSGLVEPIGGATGVTVVAMASGLLPGALGFAAGAMLYVVASELIPQTHGNQERAGPATSGLMAGLAIMMFLDVVFR